jgi:hypothetical protein
MLVLRRRLYAHEIERRHHPSVPMSPLSIKQRFMQGGAFILSVTVGPSSVPEALIARGQFKTASLDEPPPSSWRSRAEPGP